MRLIFVISFLKDLKTIIFSMAFVFAFLCQIQLHAANKCTQLFQDRYGQLSQNHTYFFKHRMNLNEKETMLCGPVSVLNVLEKIRHETYPNYKISNRPTEIAKMIGDVMPILIPKIKHANPSFNFLSNSNEVFNKGTTSTVLTYLLRYYIEKENLPYFAVMQNFTSSYDSIKFQSIEANLKKGPAIITLGFYKDGARVGGHHMIVTKVDTKNNILVVLNPEKPRILTDFYFKESKIRNSFNQTLLLDLKAMDINIENFQSYIEDIIYITKKSE